MPAQKEHGMEPAMQNGASNGRRLGCVRSFFENQL
jgi:hypothetical protein